MSELHDMAKDLGVETIENQWRDTELLGRCYRPSLDIAHECLAKLPEDSGVLSIHYCHGHWKWHHAPVNGGTFIECVIALWKRQKAST